MTSSIDQTGSGASAAPTVALVNGAATAPPPSGLRPTGGHTPGPWDYERSIDGRDFQRAWVGRLDENRYVALSCGVTRSEADANARLIAAAPDMLEALLAHEAAQSALNDADEHAECAEAEGWRNDPTGSSWVSGSYDRANKMFEVAAELRLAAIAKAVQP